MKIKSVATFVTGFVKGLERFRALDLKHLAAGAVLYNGEQRFAVQSVDVFNPLLVEDIWETLTLPKEQAE